jgi:hypothetical protein
MPRGLALTLGCDSHPLLPFRFGSEQVWLLEDLLLIRKGRLEIRRPILGVVVRSPLMVIRWRRRRGFVEHCVHVLHYDFVHLRVFVRETGLVFWFPAVSPSGRMSVREEKWRARRTICTPSCRLQCRLTLHSTLFPQLSQQGLVVAWLGACL